MLHLGQNHFFVISKRAEGWKESEQRQRNIGRQSIVGSFDPFTKDLRQFKMKEPLTTFKKSKKGKGRETEKAVGQETESEAGGNALT